MTQPDARRRADMVRIISLFLLAAAVFLVTRWMHVSPSSFTPARIRAWILDLGTWGALVFVILYALRAVVLIIPVGILSLAGGLAYGPLWGGVAILAGATLGSCLAFLVARHLGRGFLERFPGLRRGRIGALDEMSERAGFKLILLVRLIPLFQYDAVNFGAGLSRMRLGDYALGSLIGMAPAGFVAASLGSSLTQVRSLRFVVSLGLFLLLVLAPVLYKAIRRGRTRGNSSPGASGPGAASR